MTSGAGFVAVKYEGGVAMAGERALSYGSMLRFPGVSRIRVFGNHTAIGCAGDHADFQWLCDYLDQVIRNDKLYQDGNELDAEEIFHLITRVVYNKRSRFEPLLGQLVIIGFANGKALLGNIDSRGCYFTNEDCTASGMAAAIATPLLRKRLSALGKLPTREQATQILFEALQVLQYRDGRAYNKIEIAYCDANGVALQAKEEDLRSC